MSLRGLQKCVCVCVCVLFSVGLMALSELAVIRVTSTTLRQTGGPTSYFQKTQHVLWSAAVTTYIKKKKKVMMSVSFFIFSTHQHSFCGLLNADTLLSLVTRCNHQHRQVERVQCCSYRPVFNVTVKE